MTHVVVVGAQWGDEGKGKIVDWLSSRADVVVRFQGGHNAGHTLVIDDVSYKLSLLPSGVVRDNKVSVIGNGVVFDPEAFLQEVARLEQQGVRITTQKLKIAKNVPLILPLHRELDVLREEALSARKIGTTGRGIGPAYEDKVGRRAIRTGDLYDDDTLKGRIERLLGHHNAIRRGLGVTEVDGQDVYSTLVKYRDVLAPFLADVPELLLSHHQQGHKILFEGAQGALLDVDHGTYPFVTSSTTGSAAAASGSGFMVHALDRVLGIVKAYTTRVGSGPFPTELNDEVGRTLGERGHEFGTVTGRQRRCGWFDAVLVRHSIVTAGINALALTKLDILDVFDDIKLCVGYELDGQQISTFPTSEAEQARITPVYETMKGWKCSTYGARSWKDLPAEAIKFVRRVEELVGAPVHILSTSPDRDDTILVADPFLP